MRGGVVASATFRVRTPHFTAWDRAYLKIRCSILLAGVRGSRTHLPRSSRGITDLKNVRHSGRHHADGDFGRYNIYGVRLATSEERRGIVLSGRRLIIAIIHVWLYRNTRDNYSHKHLPFDHGPMLGNQFQFIGRPIELVNLQPAI